MPRRHGCADASVRFDALRALLGALGFSERIRGSHHICGKASVREILNPQRDGRTAKDWQADTAHKYALVVAWSREGAAFVVDAQELPGCMAHGGTPAEAVAKAQDAIGLWLAPARDMGRPVPSLAAAG